MTAGHVCISGAARGLGEPTPTLTLGTHHADHPLPRQNPGQEEKPSEAIRSREVAMRVGQKRPPPREQQLSLCPTCPQDRNPSARDHVG